MSSFNSWKSGTSALMALAIAASSTPLGIAPPASAQLFPSSPSPSRTQITIPTGTSIPVRYDEAEKIVIAPTETMPVTLKVAANIINRSGSILIPAGSLVVGQMQPADGGSQFVARELVTYQGRRQAISASSDVINTTEVSRGASTGNILKGAVVGAAAAAALGGLTGDRRITAGEVLIGTGVGAAGGLVLGRKKADVVVVDPDTDLNLTLNSSLALR